VVRRNLVAVENYGHDDAVAKPGEEATMTEFAWLDWFGCATLPATD
jgi:hypothetical protein